MRNWRIALAVAGLLIAAGPHCLPLTTRPLTGQPQHCMPSAVYMGYTLIAQDD
jgi:hypothetical protein